MFCKLLQVVVSVSVSASECQSTVVREVSQLASYLCCKAELMIVG